MPHTKTSICRECDRDTAPGHDDKLFINRVPHEDEDGNESYICRECIAEIFGGDNADN